MQTASTRASVSMVQLLLSCSASPIVLTTRLVFLFCCFARAAGQMLFSRTIWDDMMTQDPQIIGKVNPNNDAIAAKFGDQGGYQGSTMQ